MCAKANSHQAAEVLVKHCLLIMILSEMFQMYKLENVVYKPGKLPEASQETII